MRLRHIQLSRIYLKFEKSSEKSFKKHALATTKGGDLLQKVEFSEGRRSSQGVQYGGGVQVHEGGQERQANLPSLRVLVPAVTRIMHQNMPFHLDEKLVIFL